jgi:hypothetical protein
MSTMLHDRQLVDAPSVPDDSACRAIWLQRLTWAFVALGVALRVWRYLLHYPLWWDEAFVAVNFLERGYLDLLRPLDYGQVCPILFLWAELSVVKLLGFSEWSLRLFPLACAVLSVMAFRFAAGQVLRGSALLLAVAIFAVSFHPIRHAADVKPYASDLLMALALIAPALAWWRNPEQSRSMWLLALVTPIAVALSHPAVFVAGGCALALALPVAKSSNRGVWLAYSAFCVAMTGTFVGLYFLFTRAQTAATLAPMLAQWGAAFPPRHDAWALLKWLVSVHTGGMFAYPCGGEQGGSILTAVLFLVGALVFWRTKRGVALGLCLFPFGVALVAAALRRYPYGGVAHGSPARVMQYLVPAICLLAGTGVATLLARIRNPGRQLRLLCAGLSALVLIGVVPIVLDGFHPYRAIHAQRAREFARQFWPELCRDADPICLRWDVGLGEWDSTNLNVAVYLCNEQIYSPQRRSGNARRPNRTSQDRPLRCVLSLMDPSDPRVARWLATMERDFDLPNRRTLDVDMNAATGRPRIESYVVYEFVPKKAEPPRRVAGNQTDATTRSLKSYISR